MQKQILEYTGKHVSPFPAYVDKEQNGEPCFKNGNYS